MVIDPQQVLAYLGLPAEQPSLDYLNALLDRWSRRIPWESVSRIARHKTQATPADYARLPDRYFEQALTQGTGGTCFESNLSLWSLLSALGFTATLHFCDMEGEIVNPHCALIVRLEGQPYLADVGYPIPTALLLQPDQPTQVQTAVYRFAATPETGARWRIRRISGMYESLAFVVKGDAIGEAAFHERLLRDHEPNGLFLNQVIVQKMMDGYMLRYSDDKGLIQRTVGMETPIPLTPDEQADLPVTLSARFGMDAALLRTVLSRV
jgi:hypothetical protein